MADWTYFRDEVIVNDSFAQELQSEFRARNLRPGATLLIAARRVEHADGYTLRLEGFHVQVVANFYDGAGGAIDVSGHDGAAGAAGAQGEAGYASAGSSRPGAPGGAGAPGQPGTSAGTIMLFAENIRRARLLARGGAGGDGGRGGGGGRGGDGRLPTSRIDGWDGTEGGNGGAGGDGAVGGNGGQIVVARAGGENPDADGVGGRAGVGGSGGGGGRAGRLADPDGDGADGPRGTDGIAGASATTSSTTVALADWWGGVRTLLASAATQWADYRTEVGSYDYRRYAPARPDAAGLLVVALDEFGAALNLAPNWPRAVQFTQQITANQTPIAVARNVDVIPDFSRFEAVVTDYGPLVLSLFSNARALILEAADVGRNQGRLRIDAQNVRNATETLSRELQIVGLERLRAVAERGQADNRLAANQAALDALAAEERQRQVELDESRIGTVLEIAVAIVAVAAAIYTGGASIAALAAIPGLLIKAGSSLSDEVGYDPAPDLYYVRGRHLEDWFERDPNGGIRLRPELNDLIGGLSKAIDATRGFVDKFRALAELERTTVDGQTQTRSKDLLRERLELTFAKALAVMRDEQTALEVTAAQRRVQLNEANATSLEQQALVLTQDVNQLGQLARVLVNQAQSYADTITKYSFLATRALDLWTFTDRVNSFTFDAGYIHPDRLADAYLALSRGDTSRVIHLLGEYLPSWGRLPSVISLRDDFEEYDRQLVSELGFFSVTEPAVLESLQLTSTATFDLTIDDFPTSRREAKTDTAFVALVGATASTPRITVLLEHTGTSWTRRIDGSVMPIEAPPRTTPVSAGLTRGDLGGIANGFQNQSFWGRSPAARWRIRIEPDELSHSMADLSGVTEITVALAFRSILLV